MPETHHYCSNQNNLTLDEKKRNNMPRKYLTRPCNHIFNFKPRFTPPKPLAQPEFKVMKPLTVETRLKLNPSKGA